MFEHPDVAPFDEDDYRTAFEKEFGKPKVKKESGLAWKGLAAGTLLLALILLKLFGVAK